MKRDICCDKKIKVYRWILSLCLLAFVGIFVSLLAEYFRQNARGGEIYTEEQPVQGTANAQNGIPEQVIPMGIPVGLYMETEGILVAEVGAVSVNGGEPVVPCKGLIQAGDYILCINGEAVNTKEELIEIVKNSEGEVLTIDGKREDRDFSCTVTPVRNKAGEYKIGIWLKDNLQGIGTVTFMDSNGNYGALGHGISDEGIGKPVSVKAGTLYKTTIINVQKGRQGEPGEMTGMINYNGREMLGSIDKNCDMGLYGVMNPQKARAEQCNCLGEDAEIPEGCPIPGEAVFCAGREEVAEGPAYILCDVTGELCYYEAEITKIRSGVNSGSKTLELRITDATLLGLTGGIVQGMSGSPILQNGKLVGAVTHVLIDNPERGYGAFIGDMLKELYLCTEENESTQ